MPLENDIRGAVCAVAAAAMFAVMGASIKILAGAGVPNTLIVFFRSAFGLLVLLPWLAHVGLAGLRSRCLALHALRATTGLLSMYCFFFALGRLKLGDAMLLNYTAPLFVPMLALGWLGEPVPRRLWAGIVTGFAGVTLILKPGLGVFAPAALIGLLSGVLAALTLVSIRRVAREEQTTAIVFYYSAIATGLAAPPAAFAWTMIRPAELGLLLLTGILATAGQWLLTRAYSLSPAARVGPFTYSAVVFAAVLGWAFWGEVPDELFVLGALLVVIGGVLAIRQLDIRLGAAQPPRRPV